MVTTTQLWLMVGIPALANAANYAVLFLFLRSKFRSLEKRSHKMPERLVSADGAATIR